MMNGNTAMSDMEEQSYREQLSKIRFKQSLVQGFTGPTIFGLMAAGGSALLGAAGWGTSTAVIASFAVGGVAIAAVIGLYVVSRLGAEVTSIEHAYQAKQIAKGINGKTLEIDQKPVAFPSQDKTAATALMDQADAAPEKPLADVPAPTVTAERTLENRVVPIAAAKEQTAAKPETFTARVAANDEQPAQPAPVRA